MFAKGFCIVFLTAFVEDLRYSNMNLLTLSRDGGHEKLFSNGERFLIPFFASQLWANGKQQKWRENSLKLQTFWLAGLSDYML